MISKEELQKILQSSFGETLTGSSSGTFINTADEQLTDSLFAEHAEYVRRLSPKTDVITVKLGGRCPSLPYYPFLDIVRERFDGKPREEIGTLLERAAVYRCHRKLFEDYFMNTQLPRAEELIAEEIGFEKHRFRTDLMSLLMTAAEGNLVLMIHGLENISRTSAEFVLGLHEFCETEKAQFIFAMNLSGILESDSAPSGLRDFADDVFSVYPVFDPGTKKTPWEETPDISPADPSGHSAAGLLSFLCLEEAAADAVMHISAKDDDTALTALMVTTLSQLYQDEFDAALVHANLFMDRSSRTGSALWQSRACRITSMLYFRKGDADNAAGLAHLALQHSAESGDISEQALSHFTLFVEKDATNTVFSEPGKYGEFCENTIRLFEEACFDSHLSYVLTRSVYLMFLFRGGREVLALETCNRGISLATGSGNEFRLAAAFQSQGLLLQSLKRNNAALAAYVRSEKIMEHIGSPLEKARVYNGRGYFYFFTEQYPQAVEYYYSALALLERSKQYDELCTTLVNIAFVYLFCFRFDECIHYLEETLRVMNYLNISDLPFHPRFFIYCVLGIAYVKKKRISKALELVNRIHSHQRVSLIDRHEYYDFLLAEIERFNGNTAAAAARYEKAIASALEIEAETNHIVLFCFYEYGSMYLHAGEPVKAREVFSRAVSGPGRNGSCGFHLELISAAAEGKEPPSMPDLPFRRFDSSVVIHFVKLDATLNRLHRTIMEINFLNSLQRILASAPDTEGIIASAGGLISRTPIGTFCVIGVPRPNETGPTAFDAIYTSSPVDRQHLAPVFDTILKGCGPESRLTSGHLRFSGSALLEDIYHTAYVPLLSGETISGFILVLSGKKDVAITQDDVRTLEIAAQQMTTSIELKEANARILRSAAVDSLTGAFSRKELYSRIEIERERLCRYSGENRNRFSLMLIDLDDFRDYNDAYGRQAGDAALTEFTSVLESSVRGVDVIGRLGGDEFVVMLPETSAQEASVIAERILDGLRGWQPIERIEADDGAGFPAKLGCSIGITDYGPDENLSIDQLLVRADRAMREAKLAGKNRFRINS